MTAAFPPRRAALRLRLHGARWLLPGEPQVLVAARGGPVLSTLQADMQAALQAADRRGTYSTVEPAPTAAFARAAAAVFAPEGLLCRLSHGTLRALESHNEYFSLYLLPFSRLVARLCPGHTVTTQAHSSVTSYASCCTTYTPTARRTRRYTRYRLPLYLPFTSPSPPRRHRRHPQTPSPSPCVLGCLGLGAQTPSPSLHSPI